MCVFSKAFHAVYNDSWPDQHSSEGVLPWQVCGVTTKVRNSIRARRYYTTRTHILISVPIRAFQRSLLSLLPHCKGMQAKSSRMSSLVLHRVSYVYLLYVIIYSTIAFIKQCVLLTLCLACYFSEYCICMVTVVSRNGPIRNSVLPNHMTDLANYIGLGSRYAVIDLILEEIFD